MKKKEEFDHLFAKLEEEKKPKKEKSKHRKESTTPKEPENQIQEPFPMETSDDQNQEPSNNPILPSPILNSRLKIDDDDDEDEEEFDVDIFDKKTPVTAATPLRKEINNEKVIAETLHLDSSDEEDDVTQKKVVAKKNNKLFSDDEDEDEDEEKEEKAIDHVDKKVETTEVTTTADEEERNAIVVEEEREEEMKFSEEILVPSSDDIQPMKVQSPVTVLATTSKDSPREKVEEEEEDLFGDAFDDLAGHGDDLDTFPQL
jgi:hypothetical protein